MKHFGIVIIIFLSSLIKQTHAQEIQKYANVGKFDSFKKIPPTIPHANPKWVVVGQCMYRQHFLNPGTATYLDSVYCLLYPKLQNLSGKYSWYKSRAHPVRNDKFIYIISADSTMCCMLYSENACNVSCVCFQFDPDKVSKKYVSVYDSYTEISPLQMIEYLEDMLPVPPRERRK
jgi:hypothetical protein